MHFTTFLILATLVLGAPNKPKKGPTPYRYVYELHDTTRHDSPFFIFVSETGRFTDGRNIQLRSVGNGEHIPVIDQSSPVFQGQLNKSQLQGVKYFPAAKKHRTGLVAGLRAISKDRKDRDTSYEIIFSKEKPGNEVGFRGWALYQPERTDGIYHVAADVGPFSNTFLFALCEKENGTYYQLEYAQANGLHNLVKKPKGCYETQIYATLAPPYGKSSKAS